MYLGGWQHRSGQIGLSKPNMTEGPNFFWGGVGSPDMCDFWKEKVPTELMGCVMVTSFLVIAFLPPFARVNVPGGILCGSNVLGKRYLKAFRCHADGRPLAGFHASASPKSHCFFSNPTRESRGYEGVVVVWYGCTLAVISQFLGVWWNG